MSKIKFFLLILSFALPSGYSEGTLSEYYERIKEECHDLPCIRREMDRINNEILQLLTERTAYVKRSGDLKSKTTQIADDRKRVTDQEEKIISKSLALELPLDISLPAFRLIMENSIQFQQQCINKICKKEENMGHTIVHQKKKFFIGLELRTNNEECSEAMPAHKERFFKENILAKIPNKVNSDILALYTDYEGDYTQPYSWILGCEVSSLDQVPKGLVGKVIPEATYAVFTTKGSFPQGLIAAWQEVWKSNLTRSYTSDFEVYRLNFDPVKNPEVKVYIAIQK